MDKVSIEDVVQFKGQGKYKVIEQLPKSRTMFKIKDVDRGPGYCEKTNKYVGVKHKGGWFRGENHDYGIEIEVHKKFLSEINKEDKGSI